MGVIHVVREHIERKSAVSGKSGGLGGRRIAKNNRGVAGVLLSRSPSHRAPDRALVHRARWCRSWLGSFESELSESIAGCRGGNPVTRKGVAERDPLPATAA